MKFACTFVSILPFFASAFQAAVMQANTTITDIDFIITIIP